MNDRRRRGRNNSLSQAVAAVNEDNNEDGNDGEQVQFSLVEMCSPHRQKSKGITRGSKRLSAESSDTAAGHVTPSPSSAKKTNDRRVACTDD